MDPEETQPGPPDPSDAPPPAGDNLIAAARAQADAARKAIEAAEAARPAPPAQIPGYEILDEIHRGGQGVVYKAIQQNTRRKVAIKVMLQGAFAGARDHARFEREVQILAQIRDPGVVAIHDSGQADGHFFYVMDYISGLPLDEHLAQRDMSIREKLGLFAKVCRGVNAAHLRGIIHRDLKPSNIRIDADGNPHILDFGLAKVAMGDMFGAQPQVMTMTGQFVGSLPWASPEQAEGVSERIDLRTDVYSLGVILYQMLTGDFPYEVRGSMREVLEHIVRSTPGRPSTRVKGVRDDVDWITLKALEKDRERRYQTAGELGRDVERYLRGEMIEAKRDSATYMLRKALGRNKGLVGVVSAFVVLVAAFAVTASVLWGLAEDRRRDAEAAQKDADEARRLAERRLVTSRRLIADANADLGGAGDVLVIDFVDRLAASAEDSFQGDPLGRAVQQLDIAAMYESLGARDRAESQCRVALEALRPLQGDCGEETLSAMSLLSNIRRWQAGAQAERESRELTAQVLACYESLPSLTDTQRAHYANALANAARQHEDDKDYPAANEKYERALELLAGLANPSSTIEVTRIEALHAANLVNLGEPARAEAILASLIDNAGAIEGMTAPDLAGLMVRHASVLWGLGRHEQAIARRREAIETQRAVQGDAGYDVMLWTWTLAKWLAGAGRLDDAVAVMRRLVDDLENAFPNGHALSSRPAFYRGHLGKLLIAAGEPAEGEQALHRAILNLIDAPKGDGSVDPFRDFLVQVYRASGREADAEALMREVAAARLARDQRDPTNTP